MAIGRAVRQQGWRAAQAGKCQPARLVGPTCTRAVAEPEPFSAPNTRHSDTQTQIFHTLDDNHFLEAAQLRAEAYYEVLL